ncbi:MAG: hypothetical protein C5B60_07855 [Chloroflexi bacterium]|nr:MAG: hypothetical protein C5B60_07855 [Chloroflexota bacterium]
MVLARITPEQIKEVDAFGHKLGDFLNRQSEKGVEWNIIMTALLVCLACGMADRVPDKLALDELIASVQRDIRLQALSRWTKTRMN